MEVSFEEHCEVVDRFENERRRKDAVTNAQRHQHVVAGFSRSRLNDRGSFAVVQRRSGFGETSNGIYVATARRANERVGQRAVQHIVLRHHITGIASGCSEAYSVRSEFEAGTDLPLPRAGSPTAHISFVRARSHTNA
jgi:hypothetical protein